MFINLVLPESRRILLPYFFEILSILQNLERTTSDNQVVLVLLRGMVRPVERPSDKTGLVDHDVLVVH